MRTLIVLSLFLSLAACKSAEDRVNNERNQEADLARIRENLPEGCTFDYQGRVRLADKSEHYAPPIFVVKCDDRKTTTISSSNLSTVGKQTVELGGITYTIEPVETGINQDKLKP